MTRTSNVAVRPSAVAVNVVAPIEIASPVTGKGSESVVPAKMVLDPDAPLTSFVEASIVTVTFDDGAGSRLTEQFAEV